MNHRLSRLYADALACYDASRVTPYRGTWFSRIVTTAGEVITFACAVGAARFKATGEAVSKREQQGDEGVERLFLRWAQKEYGLAYHETLGFTDGFDARLEKQGQKPGYAEAYATGAALASRLAAEGRME